MDLAKEILREHSKEQTDKIVRYIGNNAERFEKLVNVFLAGPYRITQRAAWPLSHCVERHPELIRPHLKTILRFIKQDGIHDSVKRNTMRLLQFVQIPKALHGPVADICFSYLHDRKEPVAIRAFSMTVLASLANHHPELSGELKVIIEDNMPYASAAFISRAKKVLKQINNNKAAA